MQALGTKEGLGSVTVSDQVEACQAEIAGWRAEIEECERVISGTESQFARGAVKRTVHDLEVQVDKLERQILPILRAGYPEYYPPCHLTEGYVGPDPRSYVNPSSWAMFRVSLPILSLFTIPGLILYWLIPSPENSFFLLLSGFGMLGCMFAQIIIQSLLEKKNFASLEAAGLPTQGVLYFLKTELPPKAQLAFQQAKASGLFDQIKVVAPAEAFQKVLLGDPILIGRAAGRTFLICQFNIGEDLKSQA